MHQRVAFTGSQRLCGTREIKRPNLCAAKNVEKVGGIHSSISFTEIGRCSLNVATHIRPTGYEYLHWIEVVLIG